MSSTVIIPPLIVQKWRKKMEKQIIISSFWDSFSNRVDENVQIPNGGKGKVPDAAIHYVKDDFRDGAQSTTIPSMDKLQQKGQGGSQPVDGNEEKPKLRYKTCYYNVQRKGVTIKDGSVDGDLTDAYPIMEQRVSLQTDYFTELNDYNKSRGLLEGADEYLTETEYWTGDSITSPPVSVATHPYILYPGASGPIAWNQSEATYRTGVQTALNSAFSDATITFTKSRLESMILYASQNIRKLGWKTGKSEVHWIIVLTETQADQLLSDGSADGWVQLFKDAGARGVDNRAITGILGVYRKTLVCVNARQPIFDSETGTFQYIKPWGDDRVQTVKGSNNGTMEVATLMGKSALGCAIVKNLDFNKMGKDYNFSEGFEARWSRGDQRMEFKNENASERPKNWSSFVYMTPSPGVVY